MSVTSRFEPYDRANVFHDIEEWDHFLGAIVQGNRDAADSLSLILYKILRVMSEGPAGVERTLNTLKLGMERIFPFTTTHGSSFTLFLYEMECLLTIEDSPINLITAAIERAEATAKEIYEEEDSEEDSQQEPK